jgi:hypothetical protein
MVDPRTSAWKKSGTAGSSEVDAERIPDVIAQPPPSREHLRQILFPAPEPQKKAYAKP